MKRTLLGAVAFVALAASGSAQAADLPVKAPRVAAATIYNWTGFYIGANGGYSVGHNPSALPSVFTDIGEVNSFPKWTHAPGGWLGGAQAGFNWQTGNVVFGLEADIQASGEKASACLTCDPTIGTFVTVDQRLPWFATVRGRLGYAYGPVLAYVTGGWAYARVETDVTIIPFSVLLPGIPTTRGSTHENKSGLAVGGGIEAALAGNWTAKIEYLYLGLGNTAVPFFVSGTALTRNSYSGDIRDHIFRVGVNYRLGSAPFGAGTSLPMTAAAAPFASWTGFYIGANGGYGVGRNPTTLLTTFSGAGSVQDTWHLSPAGGLGGGQVGYSWQASQWLLGLEADIQASALKDNVCVQICRFTGGGTNANFIEQKISWVGTVRGRVGYVAGPALLYATGGWAYGEVELFSTEFVGTFTPISFGARQRKSGWTAGGGIEGMIGSNWSAKAEYLYIDLGHHSAGFTNTFPFAIVDAHAFDSDIRLHVFRAGLNYHFAAAPVVTKY